jgi:hypothetical protein
MIRSLRPSPWRDRPSCTRTSPKVSWQRCRRLVVVARDVDHVGALARRMIFCTTSPGPAASTTVPSRQPSTMSPLVEISSFPQEVEQQFGLDRVPKWMSDRKIVRWRAGWLRSITVMWIRLDRHKICRARLHGTQQM